MESSKQPTPQDDEFQTRIRRLESSLTRTDLVQLLWDTLYESGNLGLVLDNLEDQLRDDVSHDKPLMALYRLFSTERTEEQGPILITAPASRFSHYVRYGGRYYGHAETTPPELYDTTRHACAWDYNEIMVREWPEPAHIAHFEVME